MSIEKNALNIGLLRLEVKELRLENNKLKKEIANLTDIMVDSTSDDTNKNYCSDIDPIDMFGASVSIRQRMDNARRGLETKKSLSDR